MAREYTKHLKSNVPCGTVSRSGLSVAITRRRLLMKLLIPKHAEVYYFPARVYTLPVPALPFPIILFSQPSHVQHSLAAGRWRAPRKRKQLKIPAGAGKGRSWWREVMKEMESDQESVCRTWMIPVPKSDIRGQKRKQSGQPRLRGASVHLLSAHGAQSPSLPVTGWVLPQGSWESDQDVCNPHGYWKQKKNKKRNFPACTLHWRALILRSREGSFKVVFSWPVRGNQSVNSQKQR